MNQIALTRVMILTTDHIVRIVVLIIIATRTPSAQVPSKHRGNTVTIWLMPSENAGPPQNVPPNELPLKREDLRKAYKEKNVRILNFEQPLASAEEGSDPIFGMRMFQIVSSQTETLKALESFAALKKSDNLTVAVRFVTWDKAFNLLENLSHTPATPRPDVSQIGTTWSARLESLGLLASFEEKDLQGGLPLRTIGGTPRAALSFLHDVRVIFYWKRKPYVPVATTEPLSLSTRNWGELLTTFENGTPPGDEICLPIGLSLNLLYDFFPLASVRRRPDTKQGDVFPKTFFGRKISLTSKESLAAPLLLASRSTLKTGAAEKRGLIYFPEISHDDSSRAFLEGRYRAVIEPLGFISRWKKDFEDRKPKNLPEGVEPLRFWDYAGIGVPPATFHGGSDLVVVKTPSTSKDDDSPQITTDRELARFLSSNEDFNKMLGTAGHLPSGRRDHRGQQTFGIEDMFSALTDTDSLEQLQSFKTDLVQVLSGPLSYPDVESWPTNVESRQVQESLLRVWRQIAIGEEDNAKAAIESLEKLINGDMYWLYRHRTLLSPLVIPILVLSVAYGWHRIDKRKTKKLQDEAITKQHRHIHMLILSRKSSHHGLATNLLKTIANAGGMFSSRAIAQLRYLHFSKHVARLVEDEINGDTISSHFEEVVSKAWEMSMHHHHAYTGGVSALMQRPSYPTPPLILLRWTAVLLQELEEWFFNCHRYSSASEGTVFVHLTRSNGEARVKIVSPGTLTQNQLQVLNGESNNIQSEGLKLIRDLHLSAFDSQLQCTIEGGNIVMEMTILV